MILFYIFFPIFFFQIRQQMQVKPTSLAEFQIGKLTQPRQGNSLVQVSINADKFNQFTISLNAILSSHEKQLQQHTRQLIQYKLQSQEKINRIKSECEYQFLQVEKKRKQQAQHTATYHLDLTNKHQFLVNQHKQSIASLQGQMNSLASQIKENSNNTRKQIVQRVQKDLDSLLAASKGAIEKEMEIVARKIKQVQNSTTSQDSLVRNIMNAYQNRTPPQQNTNTNAKTQNNQGIRYPNEQGHAFENVIVRQGKQRRNKKVQQKCEQQNLQYASVSAKLDSLQARLTAKQNESIDKVVYANKKPQGFTLQPVISQKSISMERIQIQRKNLQEKITVKLESIENMIEDNLSKLQKQVTKLRSQQSFLKDSSEFAIHRVDKQKTRMAEFALQLKKLQQKKSDDKLIENMVSMFKRQQRQIEQQIGRKLSIQNFEKERAKINERIQIINESVGDKADKEQIKRAFQFVQDKIRQIIMILADDIQNQKQGALKRIPFKCLSCDKDLHSLPITLRTDNENQKISRPPTSHLRKKIRILNVEDKR